MLRTNGSEATGARVFQVTPRLAGPYCLCPPPPPPTMAPPVTVNPIPQGNGGDQDGDNNGGPSDGDV